MTAQPDISVVMSVYNNADALPAALESILSQEGVELEFIVVNDGSTDSSATVLDEAAQKDARLKVVHKKNEGLTRALMDFRAVDCAAGCRRRIAAGPPEGATGPRATARCPGPGGVRRTLPNCRRCDAIHGCTAPRRNRRPQKNR